MKSAQKQYASMRAHPDSRLEPQTYKHSMLLLIYCLSKLRNLRNIKTHLLIYFISGQKQDPNTEGTGGTLIEGIMPRRTNQKENRKEEDGMNKEEIKPGIYVYMEEKRI